jgi:thiol-disulfide isomerase/thioredoxin
MKKIVILLFLLLNMTLNANAQEMEMFDTDGISYKVHAQDAQFQIEGMQGKVVFLEFFGLNCPACKDLMPTLIKLQNKYPNQLQVMAIEVQNHDIDAIKKYKEEHGINYPTFANYDVGFVVRYIADNSGWKGAIPFLTIIDANGQVRVVEVGANDEKKLEAYIQMYTK